MYYPIGWHKVLKLDTDCKGESCKILTVQANHERELFFILTTRSIHVWFAKPAVEIVCHRRSGDSIEKIGFNKVAVWKTDSSVIVVATECDQLLFYQLKRRGSTSSASSFVLSSSPDNERIYRIKHDTKNAKKSFIGNSLTSSDEPHSIPALTIYSFGKLDLTSVGVVCLMSAEEELIVGTRNGEIYGVQWDGNIDERFPWTLPKEVKERSDFPVDVKFSSVLSGFAIVFKSGQVGFMPSKIHSDIARLGDINYATCDTNMSYLISIKNAVCAEINHRHRLIAFGLKDSRVVVCNTDESNSSIVVHHILDISSSRNYNNKSSLGRVKCIQYSPDNFAVVVAWDTGEFALWSVFGSLLFCSSQWRSDSEINSHIMPLRITSLAWGREGFNLWLCIVGNDQVDRNEPSNFLTTMTNGNASPDSDKTDSIGESIEDGHKGDVILLSLARCNLSTSPHQTCTSDTIVLISEEKIYIGPSVPHDDKFDHWICVDLPKRYSNSQYPVRYATVNRECKEMAIAADRGLALYSVVAGTWTFLNNKSQDESFSVCGDIVWCNNYLVASCFNFINESFELRAYKVDDISDADQVVIQQIPMEIIRMSLFENRLLVLYSDGTLSMFMMNLRRRTKLMKSKIYLTKAIHATETSFQDDQQNGGPSSETSKSTRSDSIISWNHPMKNQSLFDKDLILQISSIENLIISNLQANPFCISSIALTRLHFKNNRTDDSILLNACGKLFLLEREVPPNPLSSSPVSEISSPNLKDSSLDGQPPINSRKLELRANSARLPSNSAHLTSASLRTTIVESSALSNVTFKAVSVIATNVEQFWISPEISTTSEMSYFKQSLWLSCGGTSNKLQIWLPLLNDKHDAPTDLYVPDRIMLPIKCDIYPLAIRSSAFDVLEPDDAIVLGADCDILYRDCKLFSHFPYTTVKRQCRVYLHRILRELLLSQHLGYYAKKIAESCQSLPYFAHCFELLLHEVLEEEATSPVPLPDPMLPQVVKFIKQFPVYLETVVHCARKSELSMWSHLFDERAVGNPQRLFQECIDQQKYDTAASCLIILQSLDKNIVSSRMIKDLIRLVSGEPKFEYLVQDLESFLTRAGLDSGNVSGSNSPGGAVKMTD